MTAEPTDLESFLLGDSADPPAGLAPAARTEADAARAFARGDGPPPQQLGLDVSTALCAALAARHDVARLGRLAAEAGKALAKEARRSLHALRARGAEVAVPRAAARERPLSLRADAEPEPTSVATMVDGQGERGIWLCRRAPEGGVLVFQAVLSDSIGLVEFVAGRATRKGHRDLLKQLLGRPGFVAAVVPGDYARWLLEEAYRTTEAAARPLPPAFARARSDLGPVTRDYSAHPALEQWPDTAPLTDAELRGLLDLPELRTWIPEEGVLRHVALKVAEVDESRILVGDEQKASARHDVVDREVAAYFTAEHRARYRRRLLDTAWLLHLVGQRDDDARRLRAAVEAFAPADPPAPPNAFELHLFERVFNLAAAPPAEGAPPAAPGSLIVSPYEPAPRPAAPPGRTERPGSGRPGPGRTGT